MKILFSYSIFLWMGFLCGGGVRKGWGGEDGGGGRGRVQVVLVVLVVDIFIIQD